jgi:hypothetical protein
MSAIAIFNACAVCGRAGIIIGYVFGEFFSAGHW